MEPQLTSDAEWCQSIASRIAVGDPDAESRLVARLRPGLHMLLTSRCRDVDLAADICQDTLIIVLKRLRAGSMQDPSRVAAFAAQTARQLAFDTHRRNELRRTDFNTDLVAAACAEAPPDYTVEQGTAMALVQTLLAELEHDRDREILRRFYLQEQDKKEICRVLGLGPQKFDQIVFRARARLRALLDARGVASKDLLCVFGLWVPKSWRI